MATGTVQELMEKAARCIHLARTIKARYSADPTKISADDHEKVRTLLAEAQRLRGLAEVEKQQQDLETWYAQPDQVPAALAAEADVASKATDPDGAHFSSVTRKREVELFAKALRHGVKNQTWVETLDKVEKANLVEDATGEVIVPHDVAGPIFKTLPRLGVFRSTGPNIRQTQSNKVDIRSLTGATAGWGKIEVTAGAIPDANVVPNTPVEVIEVHDLMAMSKIGVDELQDTDANLVALIQDIVGQQMAQQEDDAYGNGNGVSKPWGLAMRATQASPLITQAVTAAANATVTAADLKRLQMRVPTRMRTNGAYLASADATESIMLLVDANSNFMWQPSIAANEPERLFGKRFYTLESLPSMGASAAAVDASVLFGDPELGYMIADRQRITVQRLDERFAEQGLVAFIFKLRSGGDVIRGQAFAKYLL